VVVIVEDVAAAPQHSATVPTPPDEKQCPFVVGARLFRGACVIRVWLRTEACWSLR
jgi:hypothetical protein